LFSPPQKTADERRLHEKPDRELANGRLRPYARNAKMHGDDQVAKIAAIRARTGLSQGAFARSIGVAKGTLLNWKHGRGRPTGAAQVLLAMIGKNRSLVAEPLR
jgi:putative transcriptional regulator